MSKPIEIKGKHWHLAQECCLCGKTDLNKNLTVPESQCAYYEDVKINLYWSFHQSCFDKLELSYKKKIC